MADLSYVTVTIANGASLSGASPEIPENSTIVALEVDSAWDTNVISLQRLGRDGSYKRVQSIDGLGEYSTGSVVAHDFVPITLGSLFGSATSIKVRSGTAAAAANQTGDTVVTVWFKRL